MSMRFAHVLFFLIATLGYNVHVSAAQYLATGKEITDSFLNKHIPKAISTTRKVNDTAKVMFNGMFDRENFYPLLWGDLDESFNAIFKSTPDLKRQIEPIFNAFKTIFYTEQPAAEYDTELTPYAERIRVVLFTALNDIKEFIHNPNPHAHLESDMIDSLLEMIGVKQQVSDAIAQGIELLTGADPARRAELLARFNNNHIISFVLEHTIKCDAEFKTALSNLIKNTDVHEILETNEARASHALYKFACAFQNITFPNEARFLNSVADHLLAATEDLVPATSNLTEWAILKGRRAGITIVARAGSFFGSIGFHGFQAAFNHFRDIIVDYIPYLYEKNSNAAYPNIVQSFYLAKRGQEIEIPENYQPGQPIFTCPLDCLTTRLTVMWQHYVWQTTGNKPEASPCYLSQGLSFLFEDWGLKNPLEWTFKNPISTVLHGAINRFQGFCAERVLGFFMRGAKDFLLDRTVPSRPDINTVPPRCEDDMLTMAWNMLPTPQFSTNFLSRLEDPKKSLMSVSFASPEAPEEKWRKLREYAEKRELRKTPEGREKLALKEEQEAEKIKDAADDAAFNRATAEKEIATQEYKKHQRIKNTRFNNQVLFHIPIASTNFGIGIHVRDVINSISGLVRLGVANNFLADVRNLRKRQLTKRFIAEHAQLLKLIKDIDPRDQELLANPPRPFVQKSRWLMTARELIDSIAHPLQKDAHLPVHLRDQRPKLRLAEHWKGRTLDQFDTTPIDQLREYLDRKLHTISLNPLQKDLLIPIAKKVFLDEAVHKIIDFTTGEEVIGVDRMLSFTRGRQGKLEPLSYVDAATNTERTRVVLTPSTAPLFALNVAGYGLKKFNKKLNARIEDPVENLRAGEKMAYEAYIKVRKNLVAAGLNPRYLGLEGSDDDYAPFREESLLSKKGLQAIYTDISQNIAFGPLCNPLQTLAKIPGVSQATEYWMYVVATHCYDKISSIGMHAHIIKTMPKLQELLSMYASAQEKNDAAALEAIEEEIEDYINTGLDASTNLDAIAQTCLSTPARVIFALTLGLCAARGSWLGINLGGFWGKGAAIVGGCIAGAMGMDIYKTVSKIV